MLRFCENNICDYHIILKGEVLMFGKGVGAIRAIFGPIISIFSPVIF